MTDQTPPGNGFRAQFSRGPGASPVVAKKRAKQRPDAQGLESFAIPRAESRRGDHRERDRHRLTQEDAMVRHKGRNHRVDLVNLSGGGAMVSGTFVAKLWDLVELQLGPGMTIECAVRWVRDGRYGLEFAHETRLECDPKERASLLRTVIERSFPELSVGLDKKPEPAGADRQDMRHPLIWTAILHHNYEWERVRLRNISKGGLLLDCTLTLPADATVYVEIGTAGRFAAQVCWQRGDQVGLAFAEPFDILQLATARPSVTTEAWELPDYLKDAASDSSPWAARWNRLSVKDLGKALFRQ